MPRKKKKPDPRVIRDGQYTISIAPPGFRKQLREENEEYGVEDRALVLFKGEVILGLLVFHPCGEWTVLTSFKTPPLRAESLLFMASATAQADELWDRATKSAKVKTAKPDLPLLSGGDPP